MTVYFDQKRGRWRYYFQFDNKRFSKDCRGPDGVLATSRRAAQVAEDDAKRIARITPKLPSAGELTFGAVMNALADGWMKRPGWPDRRPIILELLDFFGRATPMRDIDGARVQDYITFALSQPIKVWRGGPTKTPGTLANRWKTHPTRTRSPARVNRYLPHLRAAFERAFNTRDPLTRERAIEEIPRIEDLPEIKRKARPVPEAVLGRLQEIVPPHLIDAIILTLCFGFRQSEAFQMLTASVDWHAQGVRLFGEDVKDSEDGFLPASQFAIGYLRCMAMEAQDRGTRYLITWRPARTAKASVAAKRWRPIQSPKSAWRTAMRTIEAEFGARWRWHDIRAAFITHVAITSGPVPAQKLARHSSFSTTQGYIEVADEVLRAAAERTSERPAFGVVKGGRR